MKALHEKGERDVLFTNLRKQHHSTIKEVCKMSDECADREFARNPVVESL